MVSDRIDALLRLHLVELRPKAESRLMRIAGRLLGKRFMDRFWTTMRLPLCRPVIFYPTSVADPLAPRFEWVLEHELVHVEQFAPWYGPALIGLFYFLLPLPVGFSGRWFLERPAYLGDIRRGRFSPKSAAAQLRSAYFWPWPESWMVEWFERNRGGP